MQLIRDICVGEGCGKLSLIVNKKYYLCDECNFKRLHNGKSKQEVYNGRKTQRDSDKREREGVIRSNTLPIHNKRKTSLKSVSTKARYRCSDSTLVSQQQIKINLKLIYEVIDNTRAQMCEGSGKFNVPLSHSHTISQARCKEIGKTELIWDEDNIFLEEFEAPTSNPQVAHNIWESGSIQKKMRLLNFDKKMRYMQQHDKETYIKYCIAILQEN